jgi:predicted MPP superfamily phosphohydrolase
MTVFVCILGLILLSQLFWLNHSWRWVSSLQTTAARQALQFAWITGVILLLLTLLEPFLGRVIPRQGIGSWVVAFSRVWLVSSFFAFLLVQLIGFLGWSSHLAAAAVSGNSGFDPLRRNFFRYAAYLAGGLPFLAATYGLAAARLCTRVEKVEVPIEGLPKALDGLKIAQLSDIHIGEFMPPEEIRRAVAMANDLRPDLSVVTGDFVSGHQDPLDVCIEELSKLCAPLGIWGCNGNHEIYAGAEDAAERLFSQHGMTLLRQQNAILERGGAKLNLIGVDYQRDRMTPGPHGKPLEQIEHLVRQDMPNVLLSHNPNSFHRAAELGIELSLAGHTHGGQVKFEIVDKTISPARLITQFVAGLYQLPMKAGKTAFLYVNRGLGTFGFPVRLGVPPEITLLTLRSA